MTKKKIIKMPSDCIFMSQYPELLQRLPKKGKYILDKRQTGCGGTTLFLESNLPIIIVSPRVNMLESKSQQFPGAHLFRSNRGEDIHVLRDRLRAYLERTMMRGMKILVTVDSFKYVVEELDYRGILRHFLVVSDEFQALMGDAAYKGKTVLEYLNYLESLKVNVCFLSATPIKEHYLNQIPYFQGAQYYTLEWNPDLFERANLKKIQLRKGDSIRTVMRDIVQAYRRKGYFARKMIGGVEYRSQELVVFVNEVKSIIQVLKDPECGFSPDDVTILCSPSNSRLPELRKMGYRIGGIGTRREKPKNKTFTFVTKASFEGVDFYSLSASTVIFVDAYKPWQTQDLSIDIPQIIGRQRLEENPFRRDVTIYYRTKATPTTEEEFREEIEPMIDKSEKWLNKYQGADDELKKMLVDALRDRSTCYRDNFIDVIDSPSGFTVDINWLVIMSRFNLWDLQQHYYRNGFSFISGVHAAINDPHPEYRDFESRFFKGDAFDYRMKEYVKFLEQYPGAQAYLQGNSHIEEKYHRYYMELGPEKIKALNYRENKLKEYCKFQDYKPRICEECKAIFIPGFYSNPDIKERLQNLYDFLGLHIRAKASHLKYYLTCRETQITEDGKRIDGWCVNGPNA